MLFKETKEKLGLIFVSLFVFFNQQIKMVTNTNVFLFSSNGTDFIGFVDLPVSLVYAFLQKLKRFWSMFYQRFL